MKKQSYKQFLANAIKQRQKIVKLSDQGLNDAEIANKTGKSRQRVGQILKAERANVIHESKT